MKILFITSRFPERGKRGDQSRAFTFLRFLAARHEVTILSGESPSSAHAVAELEAVSEVRVTEVGRVRRAVSALSGAARGQPAQVGWMFPRKPWREARRLAPGFDVAVVNTVRSLRGALGTTMVVDHVDALSWNMTSRGQGVESAPVRAFAKLEARTLRRWERRVASWSAATIVTSSEAAEQLPREPGPTVLPVAWDGKIGTAALDGRDIDVVFTGDMRYPPNREGAYLLTREILPAVRRLIPEASCWIVGRYADQLDVSGASIASDVPDIASWLRRAKVAVAPVRVRGSLFKVLEAAAQGAAVVAFPAAVEAYGLDAETAEDTDSFAGAVVRLLSDEGLRQRRVEHAFEIARAHSVTRLGPSFEAVLAGVVGPQADRTPQRGRIG